MDALEYSKWAGMPKFRVWTIEVKDEPLMIQVKYGHLNTNDVVNVCFQIPESMNHLAIVFEDALNTLMKSFYIPQKDVINLQE